MKTIDNIIIADNGYILQRIANNEVVGVSHLCGYVYYDLITLKLLQEPHLETEEDFREIDIMPFYKSLVEELIREKYTISDELAIQRQRDEKPEDFNNYYQFCEDCKLEAKKKLGL